MTTDGKINGTYLYHLDDVRYMTPELRQYHDYPNGRFCYTIFDGNYISLHVTWDGTIDWASSKHGYWVGTENTVQSFVNRI